MKQLIFTLTLLLYCFSVYAQSTETIYLNATDSSANYFTYTPAAEAKGILLLLPGFGETPYAADAETAIPELAAEYGLITIIASLQEGPFSLYLDEASQQTLDQLIAELFRRFPVAEEKFYMGGFSLGGSAVVKYAERAAADKRLPKPNAIFAIDPPLDLERLFRSQQKAIIQNYAPVAVQEAAYFLRRIEAELGASPEEDIRPYYETSPFSHSDPEQRAARLLLNQPILLISEPALEWQQKERGRSFDDLNAYDCKGLVEELKRIGNREAFLRFTEGKGYRKNQQRHPHAWSIADPAATLEWLLNY